jgi:uncharacterized repeat protein (TIGR02543 family)
MKRIIFIILSVFFIVSISSCFLIKFNACTITFETNGGSDIADQVIEAWRDKITVPSSPTKEGYVFAGWYIESSLTRIYSFDLMVTEDITLYAKWIPNTLATSFTYTTINTNEIEITDFIGSDTEVAIPEIIDGKPVTSIRSEAFYNSIRLTSILIPDSVLSIGNHAFSNCIRLTHIVIGSSVNFIGSEAFSDCIGIFNITIPENVITIESRVFAYTDNLTYIYCESPNKPSNWDENWLGDCSGASHWNYTGDWKYSGN